MDAFAHLLQTRPLIFFHMISALTALALGVVILARGKGTTSHRALGWAWVLVMGTAAVTSAFIRDYHLPNLWGFTPIHGFTLLTGVMLPYAIWNARRGNIAAHRTTMRRLYAGGCVIAGIFTLLPGRFLGRVLWNSLGLVA